MSGVSVAWRPVVTAALAVLHGVGASAVLIGAIRENLAEGVVAGGTFALLAAGLALHWRWTRWLALVVAVLAGAFVLVLGMAILWPADDVARLQTAGGLVLALELATFAVLSGAAKGAAA